MRESEMVPEALKNQEKINPQELVEELNTLGAPHPSLHAGREKIWVNPYYLSLEQAKKLVDYCKKGGLTYKDLNTELIREYAGFGKYDEEK